MAGTLTCLGPLLTVSVTAEPSCTSVPAAGSVLTAWPAGMVALVFCSVAAHHEAGGRDGGGGVGLGEALDLGHEGETRASRDIQVQRRAERDLRVSGRIRLDDDARGDRLTALLHSLAHDQTGALDGGDGVRFREITDVRNEDGRCDAQGDDVADGGTHGHAACPRRDPG